ncbi:MAG TPA: heme-binding protein [Steroidobacteraceae bacterium]|nr:heme-binding protein [Steroidobacteraceae bacterium]
MLASIGPVCVGLLPGGVIYAAGAAEPPANTPDRLRPPPRDELPLAVAVAWAQAALAACKSLGYPVTATYMNSYGEIKLVLRADGARGSTAETGRRKAYTVIATGMSSEAYGRSVGYPPGKPAPRLPGKPIGLPPGVSDENLIVVEGGLPLRNAAGKIIGAVSVSGSLGGNDHVCAQAGLDKIAPLLQ